MIVQRNLVVLAGQWAQHGQVGREGQSRHPDCPLEQSRAEVLSVAEEGQQNDEEGLSGIKNGPSYQTQP